jgi:competence ComEA-like helix-hairpin-helix protein
VRVFILVVASVGVGVGAPGTARGEGKDLDGVVNLNTAPPEMLELLPGIGPAKVRSILIYRQRRPFRTVDELVRIKGIGRKMVRHLRAHLAISGPTTARAVRRPISFDLPPPLPPVPARKPGASSPAPRIAGAGITARAPVPPIGRGRPVTASGRTPRSRANHCARPP